MIEPAELLHMGTPVAQTERCPLCKEYVAADKEPTSDGLHGGCVWLVHCLRCGTFRASGDFVTQAIDLGPLHGLSGVAREYHEQQKVLFITRENRPSYESLVPRGIAARLDHLLRAIARKSEYLGVEVEVNPATDYPLAYCRSSGEFSALAEYASKREYLREFTSGVKHTGTHFVSFSLSPDGWDRVEAAEASNPKSDKVFVAMWFDPSMDEAYEAMLCAIEADCGYNPVRIDRVEHAGKIDDRIVAEIRESRFVVADFTGQRGGVYFEAGLAAGLGLPVIWTCRNSEIREVHFDTRQYNHIVWSSPDELRRKLANRIRAIVGLGPRASITTT
jgi:hypothetical protein